MDFKYGEVIDMVYVTRHGETQKLRKAFQQGLYTPPYGERHEEVEARVRETIERIFATYPDGSVILVCTSNGIMRTIKKMYTIQTKNIMSKNLEYFIVKKPEQQM